MVIMASTFLDNCSQPFCAIASRCGPSKPNGLVTTAIVNGGTPLKRFHADTVAEMMKDAGFGAPSIVKVRTLLVRKNAAADPEGQTLEDAACLVFLEAELAAFAAKTEPGKVVDILKKSWGKMSPAARQAALELPYGPAEKALLDRALKG